MYYQVGVLGDFNSMVLYIQNIQDNFPELCITSVVLQDEFLSEKLRENFGELTFYPDLRSMLKDPQIQIVLNLSAPEQQYTANRICLSKDRHVFSSFLPALYGHELDEMIGRINSRGRRLFLCCAPEEILSPAAQMMRKLLKNGKIGRVTGAAASVSWILPENERESKVAYHRRKFETETVPLALMVFFLGGIKSVSAVGNICRPANSDTSEPEDEIITGQVSLLTEDDVRIEIMISPAYSSDRGSFLEIYGTGGSLALSGLRNGICSLYFTDVCGETQNLSEKDNSEGFRTEGLGAAEIASILQTRKRRIPQTDVHFLRYITELQNAILASEKSGTPVSITAVCPVIPPIAEPRTVRNPLDPFIMEQRAETSYLLPYDDK